MNRYIFVAIVVISVVSAAPWGDEGHSEDHYADPKYHFDYSVHDPHTNDQKYQWETRDGDHVKGTYSLVQPDHKTRIVKYEADKNGFNAEVKYDGVGYTVYQKIGGEYDGEYDTGNDGGYAAAYDGEYDDDYIGY